MTNYNGKEVLNGLLFIKSMMSVENVERQAIALRKLANKAGVDCKLSDGTLWEVQTALCFR